MDVQWTMGVVFQLVNCCFGFVLREMQHKVHIFRLEGSEFWLCSGQRFHAPFRNCIYLEKNENTCARYCHSWGLTLAHVHTCIMCVYLDGLVALQAPLHSPSFIWIKILFMLIAACGNSADAVDCQWWHPITATVNDCTFRTALKSHSIILLTAYY